MTAVDPTVVVGAGIIGVATALELQKRGRQIVLLDRAEPGRGASFGNMASIAVTEFMPVSRPSIWAQIPGWLRDPEGPIRIRPAHLPRLMPWFIRFLLASRRSRVEALEAAGAALCRRAFDDLEPLLTDTGLKSMLSSTGCLMLYWDAAELAADREHIAVLDRFGLAYERLGHNALRNLEPALAPEIRHAILLPQNRTIRSPYEFVLALLDHFRRRGGTVETGEVVGFERGEQAVTALRLKDGRRLPASELILCAGALTGRLARKLGEPIPLETERGYHTQIGQPGIALRHSLIRPTKAFMVSPTAGGIRVGGTIELAGHTAPPDYNRAKITVRHARQVLPGLQVEDATEWMGHRPALPDTVPVISRSRWHTNVFYATGHGHLGLTLAATTARLIADLATNRPPPLDLTPYRIDRF